MGESHPRVQSALARAASAWFPESSKVVIFDVDGNIEYIYNCHVETAELISLTKAFSSRENAIANGLMIEGKRFEVHRHHPPMIYGRDMIDIEPEESTGIALCKIEDSVLQVPCYAITTFQLPETTARMASSLRKFCKMYLTRSTTSQ